MKIPMNKLAIAALIALVTLPVTAFAEEAKEVEAGPRRGRLLATDYPRPEFFVEKDHTVSVKFYDKDKKVVKPSDQEITVIASGEKKKKLTLEKKGDALVSKEKLPDGDGYNLVVQVREKAKAKPKNFRFTFLNHICGGSCKNPEYACTCDD
tara:strand:- start:136 stop:591 length:456 start_codon:yes stop_codon:yes gene_type:complete